MGGANRGRWITGAPRCPGTTPLPPPVRARRYFSPLVLSVVSPPPCCSGCGLSITFLGSHRSALGVTVQRRFLSGCWSDPGVSYPAGSEPFHAARGGLIYGLFWDLKGQRRPRCCAQLQKYKPDHNCLLGDKKYINTALWKIIKWILVVIC